MKDITTIRRIAANIANQLHKPGYFLSNAFKTAWKRIKKSIRFIAMGAGSRIVTVEKICSRRLVQGITIRNSTGKSKAGMKVSVQNHEYHSSPILCSISKEKRIHI